MAKLVLPFPAAPITAPIKIAAPIEDNVIGSCRTRKGLPILF